jgi:DNA-binding transcriptional MerR regulator
MTVRLSIGDFSRMTHLSVKALRHYHDQGLLEPADVDPFTGYRFYDPAQLPTAQVIRRLRDLDMPVEHVRGVLQASDVETRNQLIAEHLARMEAQLTETQAAVSSLRGLLEIEAHPSPTPIEYRTVRGLNTAAITDTVTIDDLSEWFGAAFDEIYTAIAVSGEAPSGPGGGLFSTELFTDAVGEATLFVPVAHPVSNGRVRTLAIPAGEVAVARHEGPDHDADRTYAALGRHVMEHSIGVPGPIREHYLVGARDTSDAAAHRTEICWPVFHTAPGSDC